MKQPSERCYSCKFWIPNDSERKESPRHGLCRRYPPNYRLEPDEDESDETEPEAMLWTHATTYAFWWCGEYQHVVKTTT